MLKYLYPKQRVKLGLNVKNEQKCKQIVSVQRENYRAYETPGIT